ncbi:MAG: protein kinase domain-containing protein, partial [Pirellulaceae bacterium]
MTQRLAHYQLEELIGSGGMGQVWRARDLALGRDCALKILPSEFPGPLRDRLLREARTGARLQHPGIATFYEAGEVDGQSWISMELVLGTTLRERLRQGPLPIENALSQAACLLDALGHAHAVGILHRDIKPENIMVVGERSIKLLDFGLAKELAQQPDNDRTVTLLTEQGKVVGTIGYMSPEQLRGEKLDERSDLFSVGAVLYEAISGQPAFPGKTPTERMANILSRDPAALAGDSTCSQINAVLRKALSRDRRQRYESVGEFMLDLTLSASGELRMALPNSLVVMEFDNISGNPDDQWIATGIAESITADLSGAAGIEVTARARLQQVQNELVDENSQLDRRQVGLALGCRWMVSGGFQKMGDALRFTIQLNELLTDREVLSEKIDGKEDEIFDMQDRLAQLICAQLTETPTEPVPD